MMSLALAGIIAIQVIWINNAIKLRKQQYRAQVINALSRSSSQIENKTYVNYFKRHNISMPAPPPPGEQIEVKLPSDLTIPEIDTSFLKKMNLSIVTTGSKKHNQYTFSSNGFVLHSDNDDDSQEVKIINNDSIIIINKNRETEDVIVKKVRNKEKRINWVADKLVTEVLIQENETPVDFKSVKEIVADELKAAQIELSYNLAIIDSGKISDSSQEISDSLDFMTESYQALMFPNDIIKKDMFLAVKFRGENRYFMQSLNWLMAASILFTILIIAAFVFSIYSILVQKKISEVKSDFINNMTHEFKTPIATIGVAADSLVNKKVIGNPDSVSDYARLIKQENKRMNGHVEKILSVARMERKEVDFTFKPVNLHNMIEDICERFSIKLSQRAGSISCELKAENPVVLADYEHIYNCFSNLLDNADKYTPDAPLIVISTQGNSIGVSVSVSDNGVGISRQTQHKIFDTFYRIPTGNVHNVKGFGLGLSYVKAVCEAHNGNVTVDSEPGKGSTFRIFLPYSI